MRELVVCKIKYLWGLELRHLFKIPSVRDGRSSPLTCLRIYENVPSILFKRMDLGGKLFMASAGLALWEAGGVGWGEGGKSRAHA